MSQTLVVPDEDGTGYRFSWSLALAGAVVAGAVTLFLLMLGSGVGLLLVHPITDTSAPPALLTGGAIYFFVAQAFGFAVGGHVAGRLMGPLPESHLQEEIRAAIHGLVVWAVAVLGTVVMVAAAGATIAALYGITKNAAQPDHASAVIVDRLFRPERATTPAAGPGSALIQAGDSAHARAEAGRLLDADFVPGASFSADDRDRLTELVQQQAGVSRSAAALRVAATDSLLKSRMNRAAEVARKLASYTSLWIAFSLLFGALVAMVAAVTARLEDDRETPWTFVAWGRRSRG